MKYDHSMFEGLNPVELIDWEKVSNHPFQEVREMFFLAAYHKSHVHLVTLKAGFPDYFTKDKKTSNITWELLRWKLILEGQDDEFDALEFWKMPYLIFDDVNPEISDIPKRWLSILGDHSRHFLLDNQYVILPETDGYPAMIAISWDVEEYDDDDQFERSLLTVPREYIKGNPAYTPNFVVLPGEMVVAG